jgi:hypothetical protein
MEGVLIFCVKETLYRASSTSEGGEFRSVDGKRYMRDTMAPGVCVSSLNGTFTLKIQREAISLISVAMVENE